MARLFVTNDNQTARVELITDPDGQIAAFCLGCVTGRDAHADNLLHDTHEQWNIGDAVQAAENHADACKWCIDPVCPAVHRGAHRRSFCAHARGER